MALAEVSLKDKYRQERGTIYISGIQALVRLPMMQRQRDKAAGLDTAGYISGYRGSPLDGLDKQIWGAKPFLDKSDIHFHPGINEDLAATAVWGTQQGDIFKDFDKDGVFAMWYGKGPGVDRSGDVFRHGNMAGTAKNGGVLLLAGDDHTASSSTTAHQCEHAFMDAMIPVLNPAGVQEFLDLGLYGWALSRYSGCWVGFKTTAETAQTAAAVSIDPERIQIAEPTDFEMPPGGLNIRWPDPPLQQEERLHRYKLYAALAFARANKLDKRVIDNPHKRKLGIITAGKGYLDLRQALDDLGIDEDLAAEIGLSVYKVAMSWPLEREGIRAFAEGLDELVIVEEKRAFIENQVREQLYNWREDVRPRVVGKFDEHGQWLLPSFGELTPAKIARALAPRIERFYDSPRIRERLAFLDEKEKALTSEPSPLTRLPYYCSGCPHNTSTVVPDGSRAMAGIGCHYMVQWMDRNTATFTQMGGEGVPWIGQAPFSTTEHVFVNLGDGTYYHSGILAIRACIAQQVNITFKILFNDAVAMTGGQQVDGPLDPMMISRQLAAEGVRVMRVVTDEPEKYPLNAGFADGVSVHHRDELDTIQRELRETPGVTALIYDQTCAAEKRRRRKRGTYPDPAKRVFINDLVCEGCGDCSAKSNCVSVVPYETEYGTKRAIDQSSCNKDFSCLKGFCPSFVTVEGGQLRQGPQGSAEALAHDWGELPEPNVPELASDTHNIVVTGVGGTGVVTVGQILGMAAHIEGKGCTVFDMTGLAQKGGAVTSHVRLGRTRGHIHSSKISAGTADLLLGADLVVAAGFDALAKTMAGRTHAVINTHETITGDFTQNPDYTFPGEELRERIREAVGRERAEMVEATELATGLLGDSIAANLFMVGYAWQRGLIPLSEAALMQAVETNGAAVDFNKQAFLWGRRAAHDLASVQKAAEPAAGEEAVGSEHLSETLDEAIERRVTFLTDYQNAAYGERYRALVQKARDAERQAAPEREELSWAVAKSYFKLLAIKDEYEVARLFTTGEFEAKLKRQFEGDYKLKFHLAPPIMNPADPNTGEPRKKTFGPWMFPVFKVLARLRVLRGTKLDPFAYLAERKRERELIAEFEALMDEVLAGLTRDTHATAVALAELPQQVRGYGHIKMANLERAKAEEARLLDQFRSPAPMPQAAE
ncbi:indolepyruvate ferredoxin oxidoreductase [Limimonas halophila]|uniref:Indolepyruvate ferredoxin oxidoreductase n=2 Tax=Limimonas halophila TaxID=1082479 RepID=A0A1G7QH12_9PROT|nr:indolepyruvate ferredoxin oxidoreductase [Limimonas halophila]